MDCSPPSSSVHGIFPGKNTEVGCHFLLQGIFPTQGLNLHLLNLLHWKVDSLPLSHLGRPYYRVNPTKKKEEFWNGEGEKKKKNRNRGEAKGSGEKERHWTLSTSYEHLDLAEPEAIPFVLLSLKTFFPPKVSLLKPVWVRFCHLWPNKLPYSSVYPNIHTRNSGHGEETGWEEWQSAWPFMVTAHMPNVH